MDASQVADAFGVMAVLAVAGVVITAVAAASSADARRTVRALVDEHARTSVWLVAAVATAGSLWFSESAGFPPCELCWYQRIAMYPLVVVLGVRALRPEGSRDLRLAALVLVAVGLVVNAWHVAVETSPALDSGACLAAVPCTVRWVEGLGTFTIPRLATVAFLLIGLGLLADRSDRAAVDEDEEEDEEEDDDPYAAHHPAPQEEHA